ncbi:MAG: hypothetical protein ACT4PP_08665 [Sporichthyaceae bacterium]
MKQRHLRVGDELSDDDHVVVRGGSLDPHVLRADAQRNHAIYGTWGISVFALRGASLDELAQQAPFVRFAMLTLMTVGALRSAGLRLEATGRNPRHYDLILDELDDGIASLIQCEHRTTPNPYHQV